MRLPPVQVKAAAPLPETLPRPWVPSSLDIVGPDDVRAAHPRVLPDALERLPGVTLQNQQGNPYQPDLSLRGFSASPVTGLPQGISVFLDGVRLNEPTVEEVNFDLIPLDDVDLIEIIRGPSVLFGRNTLGAAVNMVTRRGQERFELVPEISGGSFGRQNYLLRLGGMAGPTDYYLGLRYTEESGWRDDSGSSSTAPIRKQRPPNAVVAFAAARSMTLPLEGMTNEAMAAISNAMQPRRLTATIRHSRLRRRQQV